MKIGKKKSAPMSPAGAKAGKPNPFAAAAKAGGVAAGVVGKVVATVFGLLRGKAALISLLAVAVIAFAAKPVYDFVVSYRSQSTIEEAWASRDYPAAYAALRDYSKSNPNDTAVLRRLAVAAFHSGHVDTVIGTFDRVLELGEQFSSADLYYRGLSLIETDPVAAVLNLRQSVLAPGADPIAHLALGLVLIMRERLGEAATELGDVAQGGEFDELDLSALDRFLSARGLYNYRSLLPAPQGGGRLQIGNSMFFLSLEGLDHNYVVFSDGLFPGENPAARGILYRAFAQIRNGDYDAARETIAQARRTGELSIFGRQLDGVLLAQAGDFETAAARFAGVVEDFPGVAPPLVNLANARWAETGVVTEEIRALYAAALELSPQNPTALNNSALADFLSADFPAAAAHVEQATQAGGDALHLRLNQALVDLVNENYSSARSRLEGLLTSGSAMVLSLLAHLSEREQDQETALNYYRSLRSKFPDNPDFALRIANLFMARERPALAINELARPDAPYADDPRIVAALHDAYLRSDPARALDITREGGHADFLTAWLVAREQAAAGEWKKAGLLFTDALAAAPDELRGEIGIDLGWRLVDKNPGLIERKLRDAVFPVAREAGGRALRALAADKIETVMAEIETGGLSQLDLLALAEALAAKGAIEIARDAVRKIYANNPSSERARVIEESVGRVATGDFAEDFPIVDAESLAQVRELINRKEYGEAERFFTRAIEISRTDRDRGLHHMNRGVIRDLQKRLADAIKDFAIAERFGVPDENRVVFYKNYANALMRGGHYRDAISRLEKLSEIDETAAPDAYQPLIASAHYRSGNNAQALKIYEGYAKAHPKDVGVRRALGQLHESVNDWAKAIAAWRDVLRVNADDSVAHRRLSRIYTLLGKTRDAQDHAELAKIIEERGGN